MALPLPSPLSECPAGCDGPGGRVGPTPLMVGWGGACGQAPWSWHSSLQPQPHPPHSQCSPHLLPSRPHPGRGGGAGAGTRLGGHTAMERWPRGRPVPCPVGRGQGSRPGPASSLCVPVGLGPQLGRPGHPPSLQVCPRAAVLWGAAHCWGSSAGSLAPEEQGVRASARPVLGGPTGPFP